MAQLSSCFAVLLSNYLQTIAIYTVAFQKFLTSTIFFSDFSTDGSIRIPSHGRNLQNEKYPFRTVWNWRLSNSGETAPEIIPRVRATTRTSSVRLQYVKRRHCNANWIDPNFSDDKIFLNVIRANKMIEISKCPLCQVDIHNVEIFGAHLSYCRKVINYLKFFKRFFIIALFFSETMCDGSAR